MLEDPHEVGFTAFTPTLEVTHGSNQTILEILGARLIKNKLFDSEPQKTDYTI